jgi:hypothetical protein
LPQHWQVNWCPNYTAIASCYGGSARWRLLCLLLHCCLHQHILPIFWTPCFASLQGYHLLAAALFAPALLLAPQLLALALGIALAALVVLEVVRLAQLPVIGTLYPYISSIPAALLLSTGVAGSPAAD